MLKYVFSSADRQQKATFGLGDKLTGTRNKYVLDKAAGIVDARIKFYYSYWQVPQFTHILFNYKVFCQKKFQVKHPQSSDVLNELFLWKVIVQKLWNFELVS